MAERWTITTPDGGFSAYVARPTSPGPWPAVVAIQEIFGVNAVMRQTCDTLAEQGYLAVCPDLFWRLEPGIDISDKSQAEWDQALALMNRFDVDKGVQDLEATIDYVRRHPECTGKVGDVGFCLGGKLAFLCALRTDADASVAYYGVGLGQHLEEARELSRPLMLHIAEEDGFVPKEVQARVIEALKDTRDVVIHTYPGRDHAFARPGGANYNAEDASSANDRTLAFLARHLR